MLKAVVFLAVFAGAFAAHQWWKVQADLNGSISDYSLETPETLTASLQETVEDLAKLTLSDDVAESDCSKQINDLIARTDAILQACGMKAQGADPTFLPSARVAQVSAYFLAYREQPERFREPLVKLCDQLMSDLPGSPHAFQASAFRFAAQYDLSQPLSDEGLQALFDTAGSYEYAGYGAALYSFVSRQLHANGHDSSARQVLTAGIERYRGEAGWHDLFQQQFTQGYVETPVSATGQQPDQASQM